MNPPTIKVNPTVTIYRKNNVNLQKTHTVSSTAYTTKSVNYIFFGIFLTVSIFIMDLLTPLGVADGVLYVGVILLSLGIEGKKYPIITGIVCSLLTILGYFLSPPLENFWVVMANRFIALFGIWVAVMVILIYKKSEEQISKSKGRLDALFEFATEGLMIVNRNGEMVMLNPMAEKMFGYERGELVGKKIEMLIPTKFQTKHIQHREKFIEHPQPRAMGKGMDLFGMKKDGTEFPVEISLSYYTIGNEMFVVAFVIDISERKAQTDAIKFAEEKLRHYAAQLKSSNEELERRVEQRTKELKDSYKILEHINKKMHTEIIDKEKAQKELMESQQMLSAIAENFPNGVIMVLDRNLNYVFAEGKELEELKIDKETLIGTKFLSLVDAATAETARRELQKVFQGETVSLEVEFRGRNYLLYSVPLALEGEKINEILVVSENITERKQAEQEIRNALEKEKELGELKSRFVSMASHEFRTPLSTILSSTSLIEKYHHAGEKEKQEKHIQRIKSSVQNLTQILNDLLSLGKLEEGKVEAKPERFDLKEFSEELSHEIQALAKDSQSIIYKHSGNKTEVNLDKQLLRNILTNLLSNAIKYSPEGKRIFFATDLENQHIAIEVKDEGMGMSADDKRHLFERFFRGKNAANIQGTGLGLNIVKKYLDLMGGEIEYESELGKGSMFRVKFEINEK